MFLNAVKSFILYFISFNYIKMVIVMKTSIVEKQVDALIKGGFYPNRAEFVKDAIRAFFELRGRHEITISTTTY